MGDGSGRLGCRQYISRDRSVDVEALTVYPAPRFRSWISRSNDAIEVVNPDASSAPFAALASSGLPIAPDSEYASNGR